MIRCWLGVTRYTTAFLLYPPIFANFDFDIYFKQRPKLSEQSLPHQWCSIDNWNNSRLQKVQNSESESGHLRPKVKVVTFTKKYMKNLLWKNLTGSSSSHPPLRPLLFSSLAPSASLLRPERPPHSALLSSCCSMRARPPISSQLVNCLLRNRLIESGWREELKLHAKEVWRNPITL